MQPRVTAILVARNGADYLERTLSALRSQSREPERVVLVDAGSSDATSAVLAAASGSDLASQFVSAPRRGGFGEAVDYALHAATLEAGDDDWIWLLSHDSAPEPDALARLLGAVEIAPSVAIAGPKVMRWDHPDTIAQYGETITRFGASILLVDNELDQSQYDTLSDFLAVAADGMLVRRSVWDAMGGFDAGLPSVDAALDFCIRVRLAGFRVVGVPSARVATVGGPELFGRKSVSAAAVARARRAAQLHRRMVYSRGVAVPLQWLLLVPIAVVRSVWQLLRKQPGAVGGEFSSAFATAFSGTIPPARRTLRRARKLGWSAIAPLRISSSAARERRVGRRPVVEETEGASDAAPRTRVGFVSGGGAWVVLLAAVIGVLAFSPLLGTAAIAGGGLLPLSPGFAELWSHVGYGWHDVGGGFVGASDPFAAVLAVLGSLTFWAPSLSIVLLYLVALPLAALGAWWCATRLSEPAWPPAIAAILWCLAPPFLSSMTGGHLGAVIVHILLPWLAFAVLSAARSWSASAGAALLFAAVAASAPSLVPALVVLLLAWAIARPRGAHRVIGVLIPTAVLFAPLVVTQLARGNPLAAFADPGLAVAGRGASALELALGSPDSTLGGWSAFADFFGQSALTGPIVLAILLAPFAVLALAAAFLPGTRRSIPSLVVALLGFVTAVAATHITLTAAGSQAVELWPGGALSLFWFGLTGAVVVALDAMRRAVAVPALIVAIAAALAVAPLVSAPLAGRSAVVASSGSLVPAYVEAQAVGKPRLGTLLLVPQGNGGLAAQIERGEGGMLDDQSTLASTSPPPSKARSSLATLAGNLASRSGLDTATAMKSQQIGFVLLAKADGSDGGAAVHRRAADALNGNPQLVPVGDTSLGVLWKFGALPTAGLSAVEPNGGEVREWIVGALAVVFFVTLLLAIPTTRRRRRSLVRADHDEHATLGRTTMTDPSDPRAPQSPEPIVDVEPYVYEEPDVAPPEEQTRPVSVLRTATVVSARVVIGIVAIAVAGATVAAAALVPLPSIRTSVPSTIVTPVPTAKQLVCPGGLLQLAGATDAPATSATASSPLGRAQLTSASTVGSVDSSAFAASDAGDGGTASAPQLLSLPPVSGRATAGLLAAAESQTVAMDDVAGIASASCVSAAGDSWLVGGSTTVGRTTLLALSNPSAVSATVSLQIFGENGAVSSPGMDGIVVQAGGQRVISLAGFAPNLVSPVVHVSSQGGQVAASLQQSTVRGIEPGGVDFVGAQLSPTRTTVIPGVVLADTTEVQARLGESGFSDLETVLRVFLPGSKAVTASVSVIPEHGGPADSAGGAAASTGSDAGTPVGTAIKVKLQPGVVTDLPIDGLANGSYSVTVTTPVPVVAGVRVSTAGTAAVSKETDFAWMDAAAILNSNALVSIAAAPTKSASTLIHLQNPTKNAEKVTLRPVEGNGRKTLTVTVPAGAAAQLAVTPRTSYRLSGFDSLYAAVSTVSDGGVTGYVVQPPEQSSSPLRIYH